MYVYVYVLYVCTHQFVFLTHSRFGKFTLILYSFSFYFISTTIYTNTGDDMSSSPCMVTKKNNMLLS